LWVATRLRRGLTSLVVQARNTAWRVGSMPPVGSSQSSSRGRLARARAARRAAARLRKAWPAGGSGGRRGRGRSAGPGPSLGVLSRASGDHQRQGDVVQRGQPGAGGGTGRRSRCLEVDAGPARSDRVEQSSPPIVMVLAVECSSRPAACSSDDLPEPEGPISPTSSPGNTYRSAPFSTSRVRSPVT
jgi:hypothetical protein